MMARKTLIAAGVALGLGLGATGVQAAPILGSYVDSDLFATAIGSANGWTYLGQNTLDVGGYHGFGGSGTAKIEYRSASYSNSFGFAHSNVANYLPPHTGPMQIFTSGASVGATAVVNGYSPAYLFYFDSDAPNSSNDNRQFTDGFGIGGNLGATQGDIDIFYNSGLYTWAFFFDDGGGSGDDNDYNDMVVSFQSSAVPEPGTLGLLAASLFGLGVLRRRKVSKRSVMQPGPMDS